MQLYAYNKEKGIVSAEKAAKQQDYTCFECRGVVRVRGGAHRKKHFFHLTLTSNCSQRRKSLVHIRVQCFLQETLPKGECRLEQPFPLIGRIADAVWEEKKIVFEVQCSLMNGQELLSRNRDYALLGYRVVWILHDRQYNRLRETELESVLANSCHYYTNMNIEGEGIIYDQWQWSEKGIRRSTLSPLEVNVSSPQEIGEESSPLVVAQRRQATWKLHFQGDLLDRAKKEEDLPYLSEALQRERAFLSFKPKEGILTKVDRGIRRFYRIFTYWMLERASR